MQTSRRQTVYTGAAWESKIPERVFMFMPDHVLGPLAMCSHMPRLQYYNTYAQRGAWPVLAVGIFTNSQFKANRIII